ncbi:hypothetical protein A1359_18090 [Methylomonas lenta]|uniref:Glycine zipper 2TM domain-containing protein n=1 Tax=Methylomonas lenta TaxID=980561 RepID=A0A177MY40_9GAMM|nr:hypothetical protein [Methylomonas lenta]OAI09890.1 hypothetical protein A1359_18090 [Methylomonas lenta]
MLRRIILILAGVMFTSLATAGGHGHNGHHHGHRHYHGPVVRHYAPAPRVYYREPVRYYAPPVVRYVPVYQPPVYQYDRRSNSGMLGGVMGSAMGYQFGGGDPLAAGMGAAAGAWVGNGINR